MWSRRWYARPWTNTPVFSQQVQQMHIASLWFLLQNEGLPALLGLRLATHVALVHLRLFWWQGRRHDV